MNSQQQSTTETPITKFVQSWANPYPQEEQLMQRVYGELRRTAHRAMGRERGDHTLQPTALVHEVFLRLASRDVEYANRGHFYAIAARAMRRVLLDHAKAGRREKRGGAAVRVEVRESDAITDGPDIDALDLSEALEELERRDPTQCRIVELRFFTGLTYEEIAEFLGVGRATVGRELRFARAWLRGRLRRHTPS